MIFRQLKYFSFYQEETQQLLLCDEDVFEIICAWKNDVWSISGIFFGPAALRN